MKKYLIILLAVSFTLAFTASAAATSTDVVLTPDSLFYFLKAWKESIQTFFTLGAENKAKQYLHLAEVRLAEYQKMLEKGKTEIAEKTLEKFNKQLNHALDKANELKQKGKDVKDLSEQAKQAVSKHLEVLQNNLQKVPEQAKKGIENAIDNSKKGLERIIELKEKTACISDSDCACGVKINTGECFFGNKKYVDTKTQCPDFCAGIDGKMIIKCISGICTQTR